MYEESFKSIKEMMIVNGLKYEIWNIVPFFDNSFYEKFKSLVNDFKDNNYKILYNLGDFKNKMESLDEKCMLFFWMGYTLKTYFVYKIISKSKVKYGQEFTIIDSVSPDIQPQIQNYFVSILKKYSIREILKKISSRLLKYNIFNKNKLKHIIENIFLKIPYKLMGIRPMDLIVLGGYKTSVNFLITKLTDNKTIIVKAHSSDYDKYLIEKKDEKIVYKNKKYAVFLDEDICFHPNYSRTGLQEITTPEKYFTSLNNFFSIIEKQNNIDVVIAEHPRSSGKYKEKDYFNGRKVIQHQTINLVKYSEFVLIHSSLSLNYAVLFKKPFLFITTDDINKSWQQHMINSRALFFSKKVINIDNLENIKNEVNRELLINENIMDAYINDYIKIKGSTDNLTWDIIADALKNQL